jgi:ATP-dependent helicase/nuclease subunit A
MACLLTLPDFEKTFPCPAGLENLLRRPDQNAVLPEIEFITPEPAPEEIKSAKFKSGEINYETVKKLENLFSFKYDGKLTDIPSKLTITEIVFPRDEDSPLKRPDFAPALIGLTAAEAGTAMHTFMQYADFAGAERDISAEAERLCDMGLISEPELDGLKFSELSEFFRSRAYSRIKSSLKLWREKKFLVKISEISLDGDLAAEYNDTGGMLQGIADCVFEEPDGLVLIDYKTDRVRDGAALISRYGRQILLYSLALEKVLGKKVKESYLYSFSLGCEIPVK